MIDAEYMRLYREYVKAMRALEIGLERRRRIRRQIGERRKAQPRARRPVGIRPGAVLREAPAAPAPPPPKPPPLRVDMGPILGVQEFGTTATDRSTVIDPALDIDTDALLDRVTLQEFRRTKAHYQEARKAFFDYVRRLRSRAVVMAGLEARRHLATAKRHLSYAALDQWHGHDAAADDLLEAAGAEVLDYCAKIWEAYQKARESPVARKVLMAALAEAQALNVDDEGVAPAMQAEVNRLVDEANRGKGAKVGARVNRDVDKMTDELQRRIRGE